MAVVIAAVVRYTYKQSIAGNAFALIFFVYLTHKGINFRNFGKVAFRAVAVVVAGPVNLIKLNKQKSGLFFNTFKYKPGNFLIAACGAFIHTQPVFRNADIYGVPVHNACKVIIRVSFSYSAEKPGQLRVIIGVHRNIAVCKAVNRRLCPGKHSAPVFRADGGVHAHCAVSAGAVCKNPVHTGGGGFAVEITHAVNPYYGNMAVSFHKVLTSSLR